MRGGGGGVCIFIKEDLPFNHRKYLYHEKLEMVLVEIYFHTLNLFSLDPVIGRLTFLTFINYLKNVAIIKKKIQI